MNDEFLSFLRRGGRSESVARRVIRLVRDFERFLAEQHNSDLDSAVPEDIEAYVAWVERQPKASAKGPLWAIIYYYEFTGNEDLRQQARILRAERIERRPFSIKDFRGIDPAHMERLGAVGIRDVKQMLDAGRTPSQRAALAERTGIPETSILEMVKLSDLARIPGVKGIRARLYHDAGVDTMQKLAACEPEALEAITAEFVARTGFDGIAPLPAEIRFTIAKARQFPHFVEY